LYDKYGHAAFDGSMGNDPDAFAKEQEKYRQYYDHGSRQGRTKDQASGGSAWQTNGDGTAWHFSGNGFDIDEDLFGSFFRHGEFGFGAGSDEDYVFDAPGSNDLLGEITITLREAAFGCEKVISLGADGGPALAVKIPAGIEEGQSIRLAGKGNLGRSGRRGDLLVKIHVLADQVFTRQGKDVYVTEKVPYTTAILGGEAEFRTLYGKVKCKVPAGSQSGTKMRLRGKGIPSAKGKGETGDEYVTLEISVPKTVSEKEKELLRQLRDISGKTA
ncbi:MAG: J domain-containing protein, partial [Lachnospiraceae bacterium]|nr:J domain-containing protein [Lachnospiraceae bacterium]